MSVGDLPRSAERVSRHSAIEANGRIERRIVRNLGYFAHHPEEIQRRLAELDQEWDIERAVEANAAAVGVLGFALSVLRSKRFLLLPAVASGFLLQHAIQGWCPPVPILRRLGFRTAREIERERHALKALRGDFDRVREGNTDARARAAFEAVSTREAVASPSVAPSV